MSNSFSCWIDYEFKSQYLDCEKNGLRLLFYKDIDVNIKNYIKKYISFLRKKYFFPIRCYIHITNNNSYHSHSGGRCYGVFFDDEETTNKYPSIYLPAKLARNNDYFDVIYNLTKLLTYYYQWYFKETKSRAHRSLEIEATKYASYLTFEYMNSVE